MDDGRKVICLNDQGGAVMDVTEDVTATLRAQEHGHQPVVCFGECNDRAYISETTAMTVRAECHGAIPVTCYAIDHVITTGAQSTTQDPCVYR